jgi:hypothetical protein
MRDRGHKKWVSLMLPEHKKLLGKFYQGQHDVKMPELDEQRLEEINDAVKNALQEGRQVHLTYFNANRFHEVSGIIKNCNMSSGTLTLIEKSQVSRSIPFHSIVQVQLI